MEHYGENVRLRCYDRIVCYGETDLGDGRVLFPEERVPLEEIHWRHAKCGRVSQVFSYRMRDCWSNRDEFVTRRASPCRVFTSPKRVSTVEGDGRTCGGIDCGSKRKRAEAKHANHNVAAAAVVSESSESTAVEFSLGRRNQGCCKCGQSGHLDVGR
jgi:hypothetical protein